MHGFGAEERSGDWFILATRTEAGEGGRCSCFDQGGDCPQTQICFRVSFLSAEKKKKKKKDIRKYVRVRRLEW